MCIIAVEIAEVKIFGGLVLMILILFFLMRNTNPVYVDLVFAQYDNVQVEWIRAHTNDNDELSKGNEGADRLANMSIGGKGSILSTKLYLNVPFAKNDFAKKNLARWDKDKKKWYYTEDLDTE